MSRKSLKGGKKTVYGPKPAPREVKPRAKKALTKGEVAARSKAIKARNAELIRLRKAGTITSEEYRIGINRLKNDLELLRTAVEEENQARHAKVAEAAAVAERRKAEAADRARATAGARGDAETGDAKTMRGKRGRVKTKFLKDKIIASDGYINLDIARDAVKNGEITQTDMDVLVDKAHTKQPSGKTLNEEIRARRISDAVIQGRAAGIGPANIRDRGASGVEVRDATPAEIQRRGPSANISDNARAAMARQTPAELRAEAAARRAAKKAAPKKAAPPKPPKPPKAEKPVAPVEAPAKPKRAPRAKKAVVEPPKPAAPPKRAPRVKKAAVEPVKPVEPVVQVAKKKTGKVVVPKSAKQIKVTPTLQIKTKAGTGNQPAGPKRVTSQKLTANETAHLKKLKDAQDAAKKAVEQNPTNRLAEASRARVAEANARAGVRPAAAGQASARAADAARASAAAKVETAANAASNARKAESAAAKAARLAKLKAAAKLAGKGAVVAGKVAGVAGAVGTVSEVLHDPIGKKRTSRMMDWVAKHPNASRLDWVKAQAKNMALQDPFFMDKYDTEKAPARKAGNLKGSVRAKNTGGAMKKATAKKAVKAPVKPLPRPVSGSTKPATKPSQNRSVGALGASTHVVKRGDTLWDIAQANKTTVGSLLKANPTIAERRAKGQTSIFSGTKVRIPKGKKDGN